MKISLCQATRLIFPSPSLKKLPDAFANKSLMPISQTHSAFPQVDNRDKSCFYKVITVSPEFTAKLLPSTIRV